jgi:ubiquitin conjugation factor E4 B
MLATPPNFISEIFYLATSFMHYGLYPAFTRHEQLYRQLRYLREDLQEAENNRQYDNTPQQAAFQQQVDRMKAQTEAFHSRIFAAEVQLLDPAFIAKTSNFCSFVMSWLVRLVDPRGKHPVQEISLDSLPEQTPVAFKMLPEYFIEDVTEFYFFISR